MAVKLGILAGGGPLPGYLVEACRASDRPVFVEPVEFDPHILRPEGGEWAALLPVELTSRVEHGDGVTDPSEQELPVLLGILIPMEGIMA